MQALCRRSKERWRGGAGPARRPALVALIPARISSLAAGVLFPARKKAVVAGGGGGGVSGDGSRGLRRWRDRPAVAANQIESVLGDDDFNFALCRGLACACARACARRSTGNHIQLIRADTIAEALAPGGACPLVRLSL